MIFQGYERCVVFVYYICIHLHGGPTLRGYSKQAHVHSSSPIMKSIRNLLRFASISQRGLQASFVVSTAVLEHFRKLANRFWCEILFVIHIMPHLFSHLRQSRGP